MDEVEDDEDGEDEENNRPIPTFSYKRRSNNHFTSKTRLLAPISPESPVKDYRSMSEEHGIMLERRKRSEGKNPTINMTRAFPNPSPNSWTGGVNGGFTSYTDMVDPYSPKSRNKTTCTNYPRLL